jgi:4-carboxymuconolactone decarboxylase
MTISNAAKAHHDELFGERFSTLASTDPEFVAYFDNFAFDEVLADATDLDDGVDLHTRLLVQLAAVLAAGGLAEFRVLAAVGLINAGVSAVELKELVYHAVPYVGIARVFDYLHAANDILTAAGVELPLAGQATSTPATRQERGRQVQERIVGAGRVEKMHADAPPDCKHFQRYLTGNCFGDTVARGGLDLPTRELLTFSMLAALGGADAQVRGHVTGNINVGNTRARLLAVLTVLVPFIGYPRTLNALAAINAPEAPTVTIKP